MNPLMAIKTIPLWRGQRHAGSYHTELISCIQVFLFCSCSHESSDLSPLLVLLFFLSPCPFFPFSFSPVTTARSSGALGPAVEPACAELLPAASEEIETVANLAGSWRGLKFVIRPTMKLNTVMVVHTTTLYRNSGRVVVVGVPAPPQLAYGVM